MLFLVQGAGFPLAMVKDQLGLFIWRQFCCQNRLFFMCYIESKSQLKNSIKIPHFLVFFVVLGTIGEGKKILIL